ncbi:uncharacterized protein BDR25DRAFT_298130 [Lindgomyces ingoldianus]|uniref:Uncharacterized protein n=1 Tax=Lindgomyces ingoldianus TaxID=673940 RepID=A0ACB6Q8U0_9PLEO|nr:uncharacterized protein BDR25DRAFT_298130 [Lindgomyces ingoldianus]KAF2463339.1 hypothetical protein BDR25DRAFT_298130 [Lindgomyces ingoldianus]
MRFLKPYTQPTDPRWHGSHRHGPILLLPITFLIICIWALLIADTIYGKKLSDSYYAAYYRYLKTKDHSNMPNSPPVRWEGTDSDGVATFVCHAFIALIPDTIHLPVQHYLLHTTHLHPVFALCSSLVFALLWLASALLGTFVTMFSEYGYKEQNAWDELCKAEFSLQYVVVVIYFVYMGFAAAAVHKWRRGRRDVGAFESGVEVGLELARRSGKADESGEGRV